MAKKIIFLLFATALLSFTLHKYYVSITEAEYNVKNKTFEISIKFIGHDLEQTLTNSGAPNLYLGTDKEIDKTNHYLEKYINQRFHMVADNESLNFKLIGKEINNDDFIYCFLESNKIKLPKEVTIKNTLLTEMFNGQVNAVYLKVGNQKINYSLNKTKVSETHLIKQ